MRGSVYVLAQTYDDFQNHNLIDVIESIRDEFALYKAGDEFNHEWFCHDRSADPGTYLCHVHLIPTDPVDEEKWLEQFNNSHTRRHRTSDRYVLYACDERHGYLIIDILDDPGAHDLWSARHTSLPKYELAAANFCIYGPKPLAHIVKPSQP